MTDITPTPDWTPVRQLETTDKVLGGPLPEGVANLHAQALSNQNLYARKHGGTLPFLPGLTYDTGDRVKLASGEIVVSEIDGNVTDPNVDMSGWKKPQAYEIFDESGLSQQEINNLKADKTYVDSQDSSLQSQVDQKAETVYVDAAVGAISTDASKQYATLALAEADIANIALNKNIFISEAVNGGYWYKETAEATTLTKSPFDPVLVSKNYTDDKTKNIETDPSDLLYKLVDSVGNIIAYFDSNSGLFISDIDKSVQEYIKELVATSPYFATDSIHLKVVDNLGNTIAYIDADGTLNVANTINLSGKSLEQIIAENSDSQTSVNMTMQTMLTNTTPQLKALAPIRTKAEAGTVQRMPFGIKTDYGLLCFFHSGITGYDGDNQGSELWKAVVDIDAVFNVSVRSTELFLAPDEPRGIVKHPMLGRSQDGRIILIFEKRLETTDQYTQYICYSSDEGLTFTPPAIVSVSGFITGTVLGSSGTILTLSSGRLVCPMYTKTNRQCGAWYSDDDGVTWKQSALTVTPQIGEPTITLESNRIIMSTRVNSVRKRYFFESKDNGESWSKLPLEIDGADCEGSIFYDGDIGVTMLSYVSATDGTRTKYRFGLSHTKSKTYDLTYKPVADSYYIGYSQIVKLDSGVYALVHEYADSFVSVNNNENSGILILSAKEVFNNVSRN